MANHKDAIKRTKQNAAARARNRHYRTQMRNRIKDVRNAVEAGDVAGAQTAFRSAMATIHRVAGKGVIHKNQAARRISRLNKMVKKLALSETAAEA